MVTNNKYKYKKIFLVINNKISIPCKNYDELR